MIKKIVSAFLLSLILLSLISAGVYAGAQENKLYYPELVYSSDNMTESVKALEKYVDADVLRQYIVTAISSCQPSVDISEFSIPRALSQSLMSFIFYAIPEAFNVSSLGAAGADKLTHIELNYGDYADTKEEYAAMLKDFKAAADGILAGIENNTALSDVEKALLLHDRLAVWTQYEPNYTGEFLSHTAYTAFVTRNTVCQGYAMAYMYLLNRVGIKNYYCSSESLMHGWNIVEIDGKRYHVDVTWDDGALWYSSGEGIEGRVYHNNFLRSTEGIKATGHTANDFDKTPTDTVYDNYFWQSSDAQFVLCEDNIYYIDGGKRKLCDMRTKEELLDISSTWEISATSYYSDNFSCLAAGGAELLFSKADGIYKYSPEEKETEKIYTVSRDVNPYMSVYGFNYEDGKLVIEMNDTLSDEKDLLLVKVPYANVKKAVKGIEIEALPEKTEYFIGDTADFSGLRIKVIYTDNSETPLTDGFSVTDVSLDSVGEKTVTVVYKGYSDSFTVNVKKPSIKITAPKTQLDDDKTMTLSVSILPLNQTVSFSSSDNSVLTVENGTVQGKSKGRAVITVSFIYNGITYSDTCEIEILCTHKNSENHPEIPATTESAGYTAGVYCNVCKKYISGHNEIPKIEVTFTDTDNAKEDEKNVLVNCGYTAKELLSQSGKNAVIKTADGKTVTDNALMGTGMILTMADGNKKEIVVYGDVSGDGKITAADARLALRASVGLEKYSEESCYYNASNVASTDKLSAADARLILRASVGLEDSKQWMKK